MLYLLIRITIWAHSMSRIVVVVVVVVVVDIDAQVARDSTGSDTWWVGMRRLAVANGPNIFQMLLVFSRDCFFGTLCITDALNVLGWCSVAVTDDVDGVTIGHPTCHVTHLSLLLVLPMLSTWAGKEASCSVCSLVHLPAGSYLMVFISRYLYACNIMRVCLDMW